MSATSPVYPLALPPPLRRLAGAVWRSTATPVALLCLGATGVWRWEQSLPTRTAPARAVAQRREVKPLYVRGLNVRLALAKPGEDAAALPLASAPNSAPTHPPAARGAATLPAPIELFDGRTGSSTPKQGAAAADTGPAKPDGPPLAAQGGVVRCVVASPLDNAGLAATIEGETLGDISAEGGRGVLIASGSHVSGSARFDTASGRVRGEGAWTCRSGDLELVFDAVAVEPGEALPRSDGSGGRGLAALAVTPQTAPPLRAERARQFVEESLPLPPPGQRAGAADAPAAELARINAAVAREGGYLFLPRGRHFVLYLVRALSVRTVAREGAQAPAPPPPSLIPTGLAVPRQDRQGVQGKKEDDPLPER